MASNVNVKAIITAEDKASSVIKGVGSNISATATKIGASMVVAGAALTLLAKNATEFTVDYVKNIKDIQRETGATAKESSQLLYVTNRLGIQAEESSQIFGFLSKQIVATGKSADTSETALGKLGVTVKRADGSAKSFNEILLETADKFKKLPDGAEKTALALDLFGRSGKDMIPVLNLGSKGISDLQTQADKLGLTLNSNTITQISRLVESQKDLNESTTSLKIAIGETTAPVLTEFNNKLSAVLTSLLNGSPLVRDLTAGFLAFGGPVLAGAGALLTFAANLTTVLANFKLLKVAMAVPLIMPAIVVTAALAAIGSVIAKLKETIDVLHHAEDSVKSSVQIQKDSIDTLINYAVNGNVRAQKSLKSMGINSAYVPGTPGFATGGFTGTGGSNELAGIVHKGEYVIPKGGVDQSTGLPKMGGSNVNITIQAGALMGNDVEARKFAQVIINHMKELAGSKNLSIQQMLG